MGRTALAWVLGIAACCGGAEPDPLDAPTLAPDAYNNWRLALGSGTATEAGSLAVRQGFKVELVRSAAMGEGSWIALAFDPEGRVTIAREDVGLLRFTLDGGSVSKVETINDTLHECRGLLYAHGSLYANANNDHTLHRLRDADGDDFFDEVTPLMRTEGGVGHGRNKLTLGPDGSIYSVHGNNVRPPARLSLSSPHQRFAEDRLVENPWDATLFDADSLAPAGHILRLAPDASDPALFAGGFRNPYAVAFNAEGEMFTFDADMERDLGLAWYRPNRVLHVVSAGEYGWRRGTGLWPSGFPDSLPAAVDIGLASPTGIVFGTGGKFPAKYRRALFIGDWAYGRIIAVHFTPKGATYTATAELFLTGRPLNICDIALGPDGAMYFVTGGRGTRSGLYRVTHTGGAEEHSPAPVDEQAAKARALRRKLESYHRPLAGAESRQAIDTAWKRLGDPDPSLCYAARIALEHQDVNLWRERAASESDEHTTLTAMLALARVGSPADLPTILDRLGRLPLSDLPAPELADILRTVEVALARLGLPDVERASTLASRLDAIYPAGDRRVNHELCRLLVFLNHPGVIEKSLALAERSDAPQDLVQYPMLLRTLKSGWTLDLRRRYFVVLNRAATFNPGFTYAEATKRLRQEAVASLSTEERDALGDLVHPPTLSAADIEKLLGEPRPFVREWKGEELEPLLAGVGTDRSFKSGKAAWTAARCIACHKLGVQEPLTPTGPDLTGVAQRLSRKDLLAATLEPSAVIDDKFRQRLYTLKDGRTLAGTLDREEGGQLHVRLNPLDPKTETLLKDEIVSDLPSPISPMPAGLVNVLESDELLDLLAYIEASGRADAGAFRP